MSLYYLGLRLAQGFSVGLPRSRAMTVAKAAADLWWLLSPSRRRAVAANLSWILGKTIPENSLLVREVFRNFYRYLVEFFSAHKGDSPDISFYNIERLNDARKGLKGVVLVSAHIGNWELGATVLSTLGYKVASIAMAHPEKQADSLFNQQRGRIGINIIPLDEKVIFRSLEHLRRGGLLALLGDWGMNGEEGVNVSLCGRMICMPRGAALLSARSGAPIVPIFLIREEQCRFRLFVERPLWPECHGKGVEIIEALTQGYAACLERYLLQFPCQWVNFRPSPAAHDSFSNNARV